MTGTPYWFFTSYSEMREKQPYVERFHRDVENEVRGLLGHKTVGGAFVDLQSIPPGARWRFRIQEGVCTTKTMLALYCASYFDSEWCAREWTVFEERRRRHRDGGGTGEHLIGVAWRRGPKSWPEVIGEDQLLGEESGSTYERWGLLHLVPEENEPGCPEYKAIVRDIAERLANAIHNGSDLPDLSLPDARGLPPLFGPNELTAVDVVVSYADEDAEWADWAGEQLELEGHTVALESTSAVPNGTVDRVRQALRRANRVLLFVSGAYFSCGDMGQEALDTALSDGSSDWERLIPVFVESPEDTLLPVAYRRLPRTALGDLDEGEAREIVVKAAKARLGQDRQTPRKNVPFPGAPVATSPAVAAADVVPLINVLLTADSVSDDMIRPIWVAETGIDIGSLNVEGVPPRPLLFVLIKLCREQKGDYRPLSDALDTLEGPDSPVAAQVRRAVERLTPSPS
ncbi:TIR domain-containing protein [Streptomyces aquilus]|uniref:TIR domain-containing protein n=1 Tax=Streptomyces aquilus TaxID=2548456 RepID=UPI0036B1A107